MSRLCFETGKHNEPTLNAKDSRPRDLWLSWSYCPSWNLRSQPCSMGQDRRSLVTDIGLQLCVKSSSPPEEYHDFGILRPTMRPPQHSNPGTRSRGKPAKAYIVLTRNNKGIGFPLYVVDNAASSFRTNLVVLGASQGHQILPGSIWYEF